MDETTVKVAGGAMSHDWDEATLKFGGGVVTCAQTDTPITGPQRTGRMDETTFKVAGGRQQ